MGGQWNDSIARERRKLVRELVAARDGAGYSDKEVAELIGVKDYTLDRWVRGEQHPRRSLVGPIQPAITLLREAASGPNGPAGAVEVQSDSDHAFAMLEALVRRFTPEEYRRLLGLVSAETQRRLG